MPLRIGTPLPELSGATEWVNGEVKREDLLGSPTLIHFWAISCHLCHDNMPTVAQWREQYGPQGLNVVAIHMPRQESDTNVEAVRADIAAMGITEPCAIDNEHTIGERFENQFWPAYFLFDAEGAMRSRTAGDAGLKMLEGALKRLMEQAAPI
jgi:thiol-disulfide isomerase/thioredoxin